MKPGFQGIRHQTNAHPHHTNSLGLLGTREVDGHPAARRVLILGDSVTYGDGVAYEQVYVTRLDDLAGSSCQFSNGACPGWNMQRQLEFFPGSSQKSIGTSSCWPSA